jgi:hypothetical protein
MDSFWRKDNDSGYFQGSNYAIGNTCSALWGEQDDAGRFRRRSISLPTTNITRGEPPGTTYTSALITLYPSKRWRCRKNYDLYRFSRTASSRVTSLSRSRSPVR